MRVATDPDDPGFVGEWPVSRRYYHVYLEGERVDHCVMADDELGLMPTVMCCLCTTRMASLATCAPSSCTATCSSSASPAEVFQLLPRNWKGA
jgi:hypothetical protein